MIQINFCGAWSRLFHVVWFFVLWCVTEFACTDWMHTDTLNNCLGTVLDGSLSFMQTDDSPACGFNGTQTHNHHQVKSCGHRLSEWLVICSIVNHTALFSFPFLRTRGSLEAMRLFRQMTFTWNKLGLIRSGCTFSESLYHPSHWRFFLAISQRLVWRVGLLSSKR